MAKHLQPKKNIKRLNVKVLFSFLAVVFLFLLLFNSKNINAYFSSIAVKINDVSVNPNCTITFNPNTGTGSMSNQEMSYNETNKLNKNIYKKTGYTFTSWNTKADNTGDSYIDEQEVTNLGDVTLYAQWELNPTRYAVQIYGINQDVDENDNVLGLTFGPATGANYNNAYVTHRYVANDEGTYNIEIVTTTVDENGFVKEETEELLDANNNNVTRTVEQVTQRQNINLHEMTWSEIAAVEDKTLFEDCMLCGDTKKVEITLNDTIKTSSLFDQYGDGSGMLRNTINSIYRRWNPTIESGGVENGVVLDEKEMIYGSNAKNAGGYSSSHIRATLVGENEKTNRGYAGEDNLTQDNCVFNCIEEDLRDLIVPKKVKYVTGTNYTVGNCELHTDIIDSIWLFSHRELRGTANYSGIELEGLGDSGEAYSKFLDTESKYYISSYNDSSTDSRILYDESENTRYLWLRSIVMVGTYGIRTVNMNGGINDNAAMAGLALRFWLLYLRFKI